MRTSEFPPEDAIELPIDGILDLHTFAPKDVKELVADYLDECARRHILEVRIIHGKGTGTLRRTVHSVLEKSELVVAFRLADEHEGGWGATLVTLPSIVISPVPSVITMNSSSGCVWGGCGDLPVFNRRLPAVIDFTWSVGPSK